jgi:purine nucleosidase
MKWPILDIMSSTKKWFGLCVLLWGLPPAATRAEEPRSLPARKPVPLIFDTDIGNDIDDAMALGLIHALQSLGECKLLAVTITKDNRYAGPFVDLVNTFYGRGDIPIGVVRGGVTPEDGNYLRPPSIAEDNGKPRYPHKLRDGRDAPEATGLLRKVLSGQPDFSVVIVQVGFSTNMARLLDSKADDASPLDGTALVKKKVRLFCPMGGRFAAEPSPGYRDYNLQTDLPSARQVFRRWPTPIVFSGFEVGDAIRYPAGRIEQDYRYVPHHPLAEAYKLYQPPPYNGPMWDATSALYAVRPEAGYFGLSPPGRVIVEVQGDGNVTPFRPEPSGPHRYLTVTPEQAARVLDVFLSLFSRPPDRVQMGNAPPCADLQGATEASYVIFPRGKTICAKNGRTGEIDLEGEDALVVINNALGALTPGRTWRETVVLKGSFEIGLTQPSWDRSRGVGIEIPNYTTLRIEGRIRLKSGAHSTPGLNHMITNKDRQTGRQIDILGGEIDGNAKNNTNGIHAVEVEGASDLRVEGMYIHDCRESGIAIEHRSHHCRVINNHVVGMKNANLFWQDGMGNHPDCSDVLYLGNIVEQCQFWGIYVEGGRHITVLGNTCRRNGRDGIVVAPEGVKTCPGASITIAANQVYENGLHGIFVANPEASAIAVFGNQVWNNGVGGAAHSGIAVKTRDVEVQGNICRDDQLKKTQQYGVALLAGAAHCRILNNTATGNKLGGLLVQADVKDCLVKNNAGYVTESSGIASGRSPLTVAHGLAASIGPSTIRVTLGAKGDKPLRTSWRVNPRDQAKIDIFHDGDGPADVAWTAHAREW